MHAVLKEPLIRLSKSSLSLREKQAVMEVLDKEFLGMGTEVQAFENALTTFFGRPAICVNTGTAALHLALQAIGIGVGDEVLVPSLTYLASFQAISATGATPVPCDIDPETLTLDWRDAERRLSSATKAIMPVHYSGGVGALDEIYAFANHYHLRVVEDAAHAFGTEYAGSRVGTTGDMVCFSFDGIKNITSGEGGCVITDNVEALEQIKDARLLGVNKDTEKRFSGQRSWEFTVNGQGWRYHMSNIMAAIGLVQLERLTEFADKRRLLASVYDGLFEAMERINPIQHDYRHVVPHIYVVRIDGMQNRHHIRERLLEAGIQTGVHYQPNHWLDFYQSALAIPFSVLDRVYPELLTLPLHVDMCEADVNRVAETLQKVLLCE